MMIKQEEEMVEEADNRSPALEELDQRAEEGIAPGKSMSKSPSNADHGLSRQNMTADTGCRQPNGTGLYCSFIIIQPLQTILVKLTAHHKSICYS